VSSTTLPAAHGCRIYIFAASDAGAAARPLPREHQQQIVQPKQLLLLLFQELFKSSAISLIDARLCGQFALPHGIFVPDVWEL